MDRQRQLETFPHEVPGYVFQHGDLAAHNIIMDPRTVQVKALIDWEHAGFSPPGMERWPGSLSSEAYRKRASHMLYQICVEEEKKYWR
jgi:aminoglycoside phosphotransferase